MPLTLVSPVWNIYAYTCISISGEPRAGSEPGVGIYLGIPVSLLAENLQ